MNKLAFGLILGGTIYAPVELTRYILGFMPHLPELTEYFIMELSFIWIGYIVGMIVLAVSILNLRLRFRQWRI